MPVLDSPRENSSSEMQDNNTIQSSEVSKNEPGGFKLQKRTGSDAGENQGNELKASHDEVSKQEPSGFRLQKKTESYTAANRLEKRLDELKKESERIEKKFRKTHEVLRLQITEGEQPKEAEIDSEDIKKKTFEDVPSANEVTQKKTFNVQNEERSC